MALLYPQLNKLFSILGSFMELSRYGEKDVRGDAIDERLDTLSRAVSRYTATLLNGYWKMQAIQPAPCSDSLSSILYKALST